MDYVILGYIFGGATIFGLIVGIFSVWNGRRTRADLKEVMQTTRADLKEVMQSIGSKIDEGFRKIDEGFRKMDERTAKISESIEKMDEHIGIIPKMTVQLIKEEKQEYKTEK